MSTVLLRAESTPNDIGQQCRIVATGAPGPLTAPFGVGRLEAEDCGALGPAREVAPRAWEQPSGQS